MGPATTGSPTASRAPPASLNKRPKHNGREHMVWPPTLTAQRRNAVHVVPTLYYCLIINIVSYRCIE
jgi:hypothetical protein